jgi:hypothetical protein
MCREGGDGGPAVGVLVICVEEDAGFEAAVVEARMYLMFFASRFLPFNSM